MIRVYLLHVDHEGNTDFIIGQTLIHDALIFCTETPDVRKLIMDTSPQEHASLLQVCISTRKPDINEVDLFSKHVIITPPNPDIPRAIALLSTPPEIITQSNILELLRILGRIHGINV